MSNVKVYRCVDVTIEDPFGRASESIRGEKTKREDGHGNREREKKE